MLINRIFRGPTGRLGLARRLVISTLGTFVFVVLVPLFFAYFSASIDLRLGLPRLLIFPLNILLSLVLIVFGLFFMAWASLALFKFGKGTPAPLVPTEKLVISGPYKYCRNPLLLGASSYYFGVSFLLNSVGAFILAFLALLVGSAYVKLVEERELLERFGEEYKKYRSSTPFLIPRFKR